MARNVYTGERLREVRFPLGGIGAGCVSIDGGARFVDWEIKNRPNKESYNGFSHIAVKAERDGRLLGARALHGPLHAPYMGRGLHPFGGYTYGPQRETLCGVPHFDGVELNARFPIADYSFEGDFPAKASLRALSPFEPMNDFDSSLPMAMFEVTLDNPQDYPIDYTVAFTLCNPNNVRPVNRLIKEDSFAGLLLTAAGDDHDPAWGQACVLTDAMETSMQRNWYRGSWFDGLNMFWQDFTAVGRIKPRELDGDAAGDNVAREVTDHGVLCAHVRCPAGESVSVRFALAWYYPNYEKYWGDTRDQEKKPVWRNWYATQFTGSDAVARYALEKWNVLEGTAQAFADALYESTLPEEVIDAAGLALSVLKSPTCLRLTDGSFYAWEGSHARDGSCEGSCQHVWNYQYALPLLFPNLERSMRELDYTYNLQPDGAMPFRLQLPPGSPASRFRACVDGQMGGVVKTYREWKISGDDAWLRKLWPKVKKSIEYAWSWDNPDKWDIRRRGFMTGRQHQTLDMELFGPNSWLSGMYAAALEAGSRMAEAVGDAEFALELRELRDKGCEYMDEFLFNGEYFTQEIDLHDRSVLEEYAQSDPGIFDTYWNAETGEIKYQIGEGCSIDQLLGQWHADLCGLGELFDRRKVRTALDAVYRYNFVRKMGDVFNPCRIYCLQDEAGLIICGYPDDRQRPAIAAPYAEETMHGFEYSAACHMILRGLEDQGLEIIRALRDRYDGQRRNPFNEIECGGNYARSMAAWALILAYQGFSADMTRGELGFAPIHAQERFETVWSAGTAWGRIAFEDGAVSLRVLGGQIGLSRLRLPTLPEACNASLDGAPLDCTRQGDIVHFAPPVSLKTGQTLRIEA